jgi:hypothetical protein
MPSGKLGAIAPAATTNTVAYNVPVGKVATFNVSICNTTANAITFRLAIAATGTPTSAEWIEYGIDLVGYGTFERTALVATAAENVVVYASALGLSVRVHGFEQ